MQTKIQCSQDVYEVFKPKLGKKKLEFFMVALLNNRNEITDKKIVAMGSTNECMVAPIQVFHFVLRKGSQRIILIHNHPSGDCDPSPHDIALTRRLQRGAEILGIAILDHVVIGKAGYSSMRDLGLMKGDNS